jgi:hypothetical protein
MRKINYKVSSIKKYEYKDWLLKKHYAKRMCSVSYAFGLFDDNNILLGVVTFGMPPSSTLAESICGKNFKKYVLELNRLVVNDDLPKNTLSFFVANAINKIPNEKIIVSFADSNMGHNGYIYQATNFIYTGVSSNTTKLIDKFGQEFHFRNIGHYQKSNKLNAKLIKRRLKEDEINRVDIANYLRSYKGLWTAKKLDLEFGYKDTAAHWFRTDKGFSFPNVDDWLKLKKILCFDDTYDSIMLNFEWIPCAKDIIEKLELKKVDILPKHRYLYFKGSKSFKKQCKKNLKLNVLKYPKGDNKRYDTNYNIETQIRLF